MHLIKRMGGSLAINAYIKFIKGISYNFSVRAQSDVWDCSQFESEGVLVFYECLNGKKAYDICHKSNSGFFTYFYRCLVNRFLDILTDCRKYPSYHPYSFADTDGIETMDSVGDFMSGHLGKRMFQQANALCSLNRTLKLLPASALSTFKAILNFEGILGAKETRGRRLRGQRVCFRMKATDLKEVMVPEKSKSQLGVDLKNIRLVLKGGEPVNCF